MGWGQFLADLTADEADPILDSIDRLYDALLLLSSLLAVACFVAFALLTR